MRFTTLLATGVLFMLAACDNPETASESGVEGQATEVAATETWTDLTADHWRGYQKEELPAAWIITEDGGLHLTGEGEGGDIVTRDQYDNFELELEWKISEGGNSGIMFRVSEEYDYPWRTGPEFQVLDDSGHVDANEGGDRLAGANYDMHEPSERVTKVVGEWNVVRIVVTGAQVEHWMNGVQIVSYELWSDDWKERRAGSKWIDMPSYGMLETGHISLQDHGDPVWYRNIRIRRLSVADG